MASQGNSAIAANDVFALFPTLVCRARLDSHSREPLNRAIGAWVRAQLAGEAPPAMGERLRLGRQLPAVESIAPLVAFVKHTAEAQLRFMKAAHGGIEISACWVDIRGPGARMSAQSEANAYLAATYFCRLPEGSARVWFRDPRRQSVIISPGTSHGDRDRVAVDVEEGTLLLFPAWLEHDMERNAGDEACTSLGFALMFDSFIESMAAPVWQGNTYKRT